MRDSPCPQQVRDDRVAYSPAEAARMIGIGRTLLYEFIESEALRSIKRGGRRLITRKAIEAFLEGPGAPDTGKNGSSE